jgi:hypothetical protein
MRLFRKHTTWYTKGFPGSTRLRQDLTLIDTLEDLRHCVARFDPDAIFPASVTRMPRGKRGGTQSVALPEGYLDDLEDSTPPGVDAEDAISGG